MLIENTQSTQPIHFDPASISYADAASFFPQQVTTGPDDYATAILKLLEDGDYWQNALRYCGPMPQLGPGYAAGMKALKRSFAPIGKLRELLRRHVRGVVGKEPKFEILIKGDKALAAQANTVQGHVWDDRGEHVIISNFVRRLRATGKAYLRYDVPPGLLSEGRDRATGQETLGIAASKWEEAYKMFYLELAPRDTAYIHIDRSTMRQTSFYSYEEVNPTDANNTRKCIQISWVDQKQMTQVRIVRDRGEPEQWEVDTGGKLLLIEAQMDSLITPDLLQLQDILSSIATMIKINGDVAGFPDVTALDIEVPVKVEPDPENPGEFIKKPAEVTAGPRTMKFMASVREEDEDGQTMMTEDGKPFVRNGTLHYREPVSSEPLREDADWFAKEMYLATSQEHIVARRSATVSAEALVEMRADYADSLLETKPHFEKALRDVHHARLCASAFLAGESAILEKFKASRVGVDAMLNAGPLSVAERADILNRYDKGLLSRETTMVLLGTENVDDELKKLREEEARERHGDGVPAKQPEVTEDEA